MKKVIIISPAYPLRGGIAESTELLYREYVKNGIFCQIISYKLQYPKFLFPGTTQVVTAKENKSLNIFEKLNSINPFSWIAVARFINKKKPDYVIFRYWNPFFAPCLGTIAFLINNKGIKKIAWVDNVFPHKKMPFQTSLNDFFLKKMNSFLVMSSSVEKDIKTYKLDQPILNSPHPIYNNFGSLINQKLARKKINLDLNVKYILFFGFIRKYKGLNLIIDSLSDTRLRKKNIKLIIAGEFYENKNNYLKKIDELNLKDSISIFDHYIDNNNVANYFCSCNLVVQPYLSATQSGISMIAFHFNKPVLATNVGGLNEYIDHGVNGYIVNPNSRDIATAILDYFDNQKEYSFSKEIFNKKSFYSWSKLLKSFEKLNQSI